MMSAVKTIVTDEAAKSINSSPHSVANPVTWEINRETTNVAIPTMNIVTRC